MGVQVKPVHANLATRDGVDQLWRAVDACSRPVDIACINAGVGVGGEFCETDLDAALNMVQLNCVGLVHLAKHVVKHMMGHRKGRILITSSSAGEMVAPR